MSINRILANTRSFPRRIKMVATLEQIIANNKRNEELVASMDHELKAMQHELICRKKQALQQENANLLQQIEEAKAQLIAEELKHGKKQIPVPGARGFCTDATPAPKVEAANVTTSQAPEKKQLQKPQAEKKPKKEKPAPAPVAVEAPIDVGRLDMRVGRIVEVSRHPDADSLYLEKIDCGEAQPRTVVSGLVKFIPIEEMQDRMVVVLCNLKPAKMRGVTSEAMVMCASTPEKVEVLSPPAGAVPGDLVHCVGYTRQPDQQLNPKKKIFETCAPDLMTNGELVACYKGAALHVPEKGNIVAQTLKNVNVK